VQFQAALEEWCGPMLDATYLPPEFKDLRDFPVVTQLVNHDDGEYEYLISITI
jgi:hypothetical protein